MGSPLSIDPSRYQGIRQAIEQRQVALGSGLGTGSKVAIGWDPAAPGGDYSTFTVIPPALSEERIRAIVREEIEAAETRRRLAPQPGELEALTRAWDQRRIRS